jgi:hypothetical protein
MSGSLIPNAKQQFLDANGNPLAGGFVYYYIPSTTTFKNTYQNAALTILNSNPIILDSAGECIAYGVGSFRQIVTDVNGNLIWDQPTVSVLTNDATNVIYTPPFTNAVAETVATKLQEIVSVKDFGAIGNGSTDDTTAINNAIAYVKSLTNGGAVYFPVGTYAVTEINATNISAGFTQSVKLYGAGRLMTKIVPYAAGKVLLNLLGSNNCTIQDLTFSSITYSSQCAIFLARSNTSPNCNNNKFLNVYTIGSYSVASIVSNGSESSNWFNSRFENSQSSAYYRTFWTGGGTLVGALQGITVVNGGTILNSNNPNTDNKMFGCEFYAPYDGAKPFRFSTASSYHFFGCSIICGSSNNCRLVEYSDENTGLFAGPIAWYGCHFEVFGTNNAVHYLYPSATNAVFDGISSYGGYYVTYSPINPSANMLDYDRTDINNQPQLASSTWTTPTTAPGSTNSNFYIYTLLNSNIALKPNNNDGNVYVFGYLQNSNVDCINYYGALTRFLNCIFNTTAIALPTTGTYTVGTTIQRETPVVGQPIGWKCTASGTLGTLNGGATTGSGTINTNVLTLNSASGLTEGCRITVAGAGGPFYVVKLSGTTAYLNQNLTATVVGAAVGFSNATLVALANL